MNGLLVALPVAAAPSGKPRLDVTYRGKDGNTQICPRAEAKIDHARIGKPWKFIPAAR
jgi:hypothetical protein